MSNAKWFQVYVTNEADVRIIAKTDIEFFAREREDGRVDLIRWNLFDKHVDKVVTTHRSAKSMWKSFRVGRDAYGYVHPVTSKTERDIESLWNYREKRNLIQPDV